MITLMSLWLPVVLSAVAVFVASSVIHMVLKWHASDYRGFSNEDAVRAALRAGSAGPGIYFVPHCADMKQMATPELQAKFKEGPLAKIILRAGQAPGMGKPLVQWFVFCLVVSIFCAYLGGHVLAAGTAPAQVFRVVGTAAFMGYAFYAVPNGIWFGQPWGAVVKDIVDGLVYALVTAAVFAWLWPH
jgi:hypothetical protein